MVAIVATAVTEDNIIQLQLFRVSTEDDLSSGLSVPVTSPELVAAGANPVYYSVARSNGRYSKRIHTFASGSLTTSSYNQNNEVIGPSGDKKEPKDNSNNL